MTAQRTARLSRTGLQSYGGHVEWRPASEVFSADSLRTLDGLRVQFGHADSMPTVGRVLPGSVRRDGIHVVAVLELNANAAAVLDTSAARGLPYQISLAYGCDLEWTPGTDPESGERYDAVQRDIRFDVDGAHVALLDPMKERARCGESCAVQDQMIRHSDSIPLTDACGCHSDEITFAGWVAGAASIYPGIRRDAIVHQLSATHSPNTDITERHVYDAARAVARGAAPQADIETDDNAFRAHLAKRDAAPAVATGAESFSAEMARKARDLYAGGYDPDSENEGIAEHQAEVGLVRPHGDAASLQDDDAFRAALAKRGAK